MLPTMTLNKTSTQADISITIDKNVALIIIKEPKEMSIDKIVSHIDKINQIPELPDHLHILTDCSNSIAKFSISDTPKIEKAISRITPKFKSIKHALVLTKPKETAIAMNMENKPIDNCYIMKIFFSINNAKEWLKEK